MNTREGAKRSLDRAAFILDEAGHLAEKGVWNLVVRRCQEVAEREISFYGDEQSGVLPEELYTEEDAQDAVAKGREVLGACRTLLTASEGTP